MKFRVRRERDLQVIQSLDDQVFAATDEKLDLNGYWWVATVNRKPVAYAGFKLFDTDYGVIAYFHRAGVLRDYRGNRIHNRLLLKRIQSAKEDFEAVAILTYTMYYNISSNNNLIQAKFLQYIPEYAWSGTEDVIYWKRVLSDSKKS